MDPTRSRAPFRVAAASWSLGTQLKATEPDHSYTFSSAKTAATFIHLTPVCLGARSSETMRDGGNVRFGSKAACAVH